MKSWGWKPEKNDILRNSGRPYFEDVLDALKKGGFRDVLSNSNYPDQRILVVVVNDYVHAVPFKESEEIFFLFTVYPSRALQRRYEEKQK